MRMDAATHKRFLDYRERHVYFGEGTAPLAFARFSELEAEHRALESAGDARDDEQEVRFADLTRLLLLD
jgi:hypothetical protein